MDSILDLMKASLGPGVAALGVAVAAAQWHTNRVKLRLDSYDRRLVVYKATVALLNAMQEEISTRRGPSARLKNGQPSKAYLLLPREVVSNFESSLLEAPFLFDKDVAIFLHYIDRHRTMIHMYANHCSKIAPEAHEVHRADFERLKDSEEGVDRARSMVQQRFAPYLRLSRRL